MSERGCSFFFSSNAAQSLRLALVIFDLKKICRANSNTPLHYLAPAARQPLWAETIHRVRELNNVSPKRNWLIFLGLEFQQSLFSFPKVGKERSSSEAAFELSSNRVSNVTRHF